MKMKNPLADALATLSISTIPFISLGMIGNPLVLNISLAIGGISLLCLVIVAMVGIKREISCPVFTKIIGQMLFPYLLILSSMILNIKGIDDYIGLSIALIYIIIVLWRNLKKNN